MTRYLFAAFAVLAFSLPTSASATAYYIDFSVACGGVGTATSTAFCSIDAFTETARSAGDIAFVRRGKSTTTVASNIDFTSDGTIGNPIIVMADYDNLWGDFATSSETYSVSVATSTFYASASTTDIAAGDWIYVQGDCSETYAATAFNSCEFAYQVASVSGSVLQLYIPYKGNQSGSGLTLRVMPDAPQWQNASGANQVAFNTDSHWLLKGLDIRGTNVNGQVRLIQSTGIVLYDMLMTGNGSSDVGILADTAGNVFIIKKSRIVNNSSGSLSPSTLIGPGSLIADSILYNGLVLSLASSINLQVIDSYIYSSGVAVTSTDYYGYTVSFRNVKVSSEAGNFTTNLGFARAYVQDGNGTLGLSEYNSPLNSNDSVPIVSSTSSVVRTGGGPYSAIIVPSTRVSSNGLFGRIPLFEYPIYADTSSKQYDVYLMSTSTSAWTANPTATELWIECEYWAHDTGATSTRKIKKSTGTVSFTGSTDWQSLSVTCQPSQTGIMYLRGWYAKTKESGKMNEFYVDTTPVIN